MRRVEKLSTMIVDREAIVWMSRALAVDVERWRHIGKSDSGYTVKHLDWVGVSRYTRLKKNVDIW